MRTLIALTVFVSVFLSAAAPSNQQLALEKRYEALLKAENLNAWMRQMTLRPHNVGSPKAKENAEYKLGETTLSNYDSNKNADCELGMT